MFCSVRKKGINEKTKQNYVVGGMSKGHRIQMTELPRAKARIIWITKLLLNYGLIYEINIYEYIPIFICDLNT